MTIFVGNLNLETSAEDLRRVFERFGRVDDVRLMYDQFDGRPLGFGFVTMPDEDTAQLAITELHQTSIDGRLVVVAPTATRTERRGRRSGMSHDVNRSLIAPGTPAHNA